MIRAQNLGIKENSKSIQVDQHHIPINQKDFPQDENLEYTLIGALLALGDIGDSQAAFRSVGLYLSPPVFFFYATGLIYKTLAKLVEEGNDFSSEILISELAQTQGKRMTALDFLGGENAIHNLSNISPPHNLETIARKLLALALRRKAAEISYRQWHHALNEQDPFLLLDKLNGLQKQLNRQALPLAAQGSLNLAHSLSEYSAQVIAESLDPDYEVSIPIWIPELQDYLGGWKAYQLYIIAAITGIGKSALLLMAAIEALKLGKRVLYFSLELTAYQTMDRFLSILGDVSATSIQGRHLKSQDMDQIKQGVQTAQDWFKDGHFQLEVMNSRPNFNQIRARIEQYLVEPGLDICFIDYVGAETMSISKQHERQRDPDPNSVASQVWIDLRDIKTAYPIPFVVGAQMNRDAKYRPDKRPVLSDIANSANAERAADAVLMLHRMHNVDKLFAAEEADIDIAKNRFGPTSGEALIKLHFNTKTMRFQSWGG